MGWPSAKDYAQKPVVSTGRAGAPAKVQHATTTKGSKKGKP